MEREIQVGVPVTDHFSVFEDDGYSKHPGLLPVDFVTTVYRDNTPVALLVSISEIGSTGEYTATFIPTSEAIWDTEVLCRFNDEIFRGSFAAKAQTSSQVLQTLLTQISSLGADVSRVLGLLQRLC
jgi:hypothetical protein